jgi:hypothetical protein
MENRFRFLFLALLLPIAAMAQHRITGVITDVQTGVPVEAVSLKVAGTEQGTTSGRGGRFDITLNTLPVTLEISCIGYEPISLAISRDPLAPLEVNLIPVSTPLQGVTVSAPRAVPVFEDRSYSVLDYERLGDHILVLVYRYQLKRSLLVLLNRSGDTIAQTALPEIPPDRLYRDPLGFVHYFSRSGSAFQVQFDPTEEKLSFPYCFPVDTIMRTLSAFQFAMDGKLFFQENDAGGFAANLGYYSRNERKVYLQRAGNPKTGSDYYSDRDYFMQPRRADDTNESMKGFSLAAFELFYKPKSIARMLPCGPGRIAIFDFTYDSLQIRDSRWKLISSSGIRFHHEEETNLLTTVADAYSGNRWKWRWQIYSDDFTGKIYTSFERRGHQKICEIDPGSGKLTAEYEIPVLFPEKLMIYKGEVFFLYKETGENEKRKLFKYRLSG